MNHRPDLATVLLHALDTVIAMLTHEHGEHDPDSCEICWHVHDELDHVEAAMRAALELSAEPEAVAA